MTLPRADHVDVDERKVRDFLLSKNHPVGRFEARVFAAVGFDETTTHAFIAEVRRIGAAGDVSEAEDTEFGRKYTVPGELNGPAGAVEVYTVWIQEPGQCWRSARDGSSEVGMRFALLDTVVLARDLPEHGLRAGDLGAVVELYEPNGVEVEFVRPSGQT